MTEKCFMCGKKTADRFRYAWYGAQPAPTCPHCWERLARGDVKTGLNYGFDRKTKQYYYGDDPVFCPRCKHRIRRGW